MLFLLKITILHVFDRFEDHARKKKKKKMVTRDVTNFSPIYKITFFEENFLKIIINFQVIWVIKLLLIAMHKFG